jgi:hypothetical protein
LCFGLKNKIMKINWGTGIVIAFMLFISFIMYFVISVQTNSKYDNELVVDEYYKKDTHYEEEMGKLKNALELDEKPMITTATEGIKIIFPTNMEPKKIAGKVVLYRPSNKKLDFEMPISSSEQYLLIPRTKLIGGFWGLSIEWKYQGKNYIIKDKVYLN